MKAAALAAGAVLALAACGGRPAQPAPSAAFSSSDPAARAKLAELQDVLRAKNDNDPRLDADFNALTPEAERLFRAEYEALPPERRNERGTVVYLIGRNALDADDWAFLREVVSEPPCLSLADCAKKPRTFDEESVGDEITLAYPALVALKVLEPRLRGASDAARVRSVLDAALKSRTRVVVRSAERLDKKLAAGAEASPHFLK